MCHWRLHPLARPEFRPRRRAQDELSSHSGGIVLDASRVRLASVNQNDPGTTGGVQARTQLEAVRCVRDIEHVRIFSPSGSSADKLARELVDVTAISASSPNEALDGADIVIAATNSKTPVFDSTLIEPGTHVTGVGSFTLDMIEVDPALVQRARVIVDQREAIMEEAGEIVAAIREGLVDESVMVAEIGEVVLGRKQGRTSPDEITFFKSVGNAVQDVAVASLVMQRAEATNRGVVVDL